MSKPIIEITDVTKVYHTGKIAVHALRGVSATVSEGEFVAVDRPTNGTYMLDGEDVSQLSKNRLANVRNRKIGFVFQSYNLLSRMTAVKNVMLPMLYNGHRRLSDKECYERAIAVLAAVGLGNRVHHRPNELSGGQQQRVAIARALVNEPAIILADEPTGNLDSRSGEEIMALLKQLHSSRGATIVMVTHELDIAMHAERVIYLRDGQIISDQLGAGSITDVYNADNGGTE